MAGKLTKRQRIYARQKLIIAQDGMCHVCGGAIHDLTGYPMSSVFGTRAALFEDAGRLRLGCQPCVTDRNCGRRDHSQEMAEVDKLLSA